MVVMNLLKIYYREYTGRYYVEKAFIPAGAVTPETN